MEIDTALDLAFIVNQLKLRSSGNWDALNGLWADETIYWHAYDDTEIVMTSGSRNSVSKTEHEAFNRALKDFRRVSTYHISESTNTIVEVSEFSGTTHGGAFVTNPVCLIYTIENRKIKRLDIYDDSTKSRKMAEILVHTLLGDNSFGSADD